MSPLAAWVAPALVALALAQAPAPEPPIAITPGPAAVPTPALPPDAVTLEGPAVVFIAPVGPEGDPIRGQLDRLGEALSKKKIRAVQTTPTLVRLGEEDNPRKRMRKVDFRRTPRFAGTVIFSESYDPQIRQGLEPDEVLLARIETYLASAKKAKQQAQ